MVLNRETMLPELQRLLPDFVIDPAWIPDMIGHLIISDLARYLCQEAEFSNWDAIKRGAEFLEESLQGGDPYMHDLTHEALETLVLCPNLGDIKNYFGVRTMDLWNQHMQKTYQTVLRDKNLR
jgi:hypothetical protein